MYLFNYIKNQQFYFCIERIFARKYPRPSTHPAWVRRLEWVGGWNGGGRTHCVSPNGVRERITQLKQKPALNHN